MSDEESSFRTRLKEIYDQAIAPRRHNIIKGLALFLIVGTLFMAFTDTVDIISRAGGGGGGGGGGFGGGGSGGDLTFEEGVVVCVGTFIFVGIVVLWAAIDQKRMEARRKLKQSQIEQALEVLGQKDPAWRREKLHQFATNLFLMFQQAWSNKDRETLQMLMTVKLYNEWKVMLDKMDRHRQRNVMEEVEVIDLEIVDLADYTDDEMDTFTARIKASAVDYTVDERGRIVTPEWKDNQTANTTKSSESFTEYWTFIRVTDTWILKSVDQSYSERRFIKRPPVLKDQKYDLEADDAKEAKDDPVRDADKPSNEGSREHDTIDSSGDGEPDE